MRKTPDKPVHPTMERLYIAAKQQKGIKDQAGLAAHFKESSQLINNWEARGISKAGMIEAQRLIGCSALWLETGEGAMIFGEIPETAKEQSKQVEAQTYSKSIQIVIDLMLKLGEADQGHVKGGVIRTIKEDITPYADKDKQQKSAGQTGK